MREEGAEMNVTILQKWIVIEEERKKDRSSLIDDCEIATGDQG